MTVTDFMRIIALPTKIISLSSLLIGTAYAASGPYPFSWPLFGLMLAAVLCVDMATAAFNNYFDFRNGIDTRASDPIGDKVLVHRPLRPRAALQIAAGLYLAAALIGLAIGALAGWAVVWIGALCMAVAFFYSGGPYPLANTPAGELFAGGFLGLVLVPLAFYVQAGTLAPRAVLLGVPSMLLIATILTVNNTCDRIGDAGAGRRTLSIAIGETAAAKVIYALGAATFATAYALIPPGVLPAAGGLWLALAAVYAAGEYRRMHRTGYSAATKGRVMAAISRILLAYTAAVIAGLALAGWPE